MKQRRKESLRQYRRDLFALCWSSSFYPFGKCRIIGGKYRGQCRIIRCSEYLKDPENPSRVQIRWNGDHNWVMTVRLEVSGTIIRRRILIRNCESIFAMEQILLDQLNRIAMDEYRRKNPDFVTDEIPF